MSEDYFTETTDQSWFSRIKGAFKGILVGFVLIAVSFIVLFWNEGRSVKRYKTLKEGAKSAISVSADSIEVGNEASLIHLTAHTDSDEILKDEEFGISQNAIKLKRMVETYQWEEDSESHTKKKIGGGTTTETTYSYHQVWSEKLIDSSVFKKKTGHTNPSSKLHESVETVAKQVKLGQFVMAPSQLDKMNDYQQIVLGAEGITPENSSFHINESSIYLNDRPLEPLIGDTRISFHSIAPTTVSVIAQQTGDSFQPFQTQVGGTINLLQEGTHTLDAMFEKSQNDNRIMTNILRGVGFLAMFIGFASIFKPLSVFADVIPLFGNIVGAGTGFIAFLIAFALSLLTITISWLVYRPLLGGGLLIVVIAAFVLIGMKLKGAKQASQVTS